MTAQPDLTPVTASAPAAAAPTVTIIIPAVEPVVWPKHKEELDDAGKRKKFKLPLPPPKVWEYRLADGNLYGVVARWDDPQRGKTVLPCVYAEIGGEQRWSWSGFGNTPGCRPLLGLMELATKPLATVLVVEGEKARDAAPRWMPDDWVCVTWQGGSKAVKYTNWTPLAGRRVVIWPDKDPAPIDPATGAVRVDAKTGKNKLPAGEETARELMVLLSTIGAGVAQIPVYGPSMTMLPSNGWDLADPVPDGFNPTEWMQRAAAAISMPTPPAEMRAPAHPPAKVNGAHPPDLVYDGALPPEAPRERGGDRKAEYRCLGYSRDGNVPTFHIFSALSGFIVTQSAKELCNRNGIYNICNDDSFWKEEFPYLANTEKMPWHHIGSVLMSKCYEAGYFRVDNERGRGAWIDDGRVVMHLGQTLVVDGQPINPAKMVSEYYYPVSENLIKPRGVPPLTDDEGKLLRKICRTLKWKNPIFAELLGGWIATAPVCGAMPWRSHFWIQGDAGSGKAQPHTAKVLTPSGWREMGALCAGDLVSTPDNRFARILNIYPQGRIPVFKITFDDGRSTRACANHLWKIRERGEWKLRTTEQMIATLTHNGTNAKRMAVPVCAPMTIAPLSEIDLPIHPYVLGCLLGDGHLGNAEGANKAGEIRLTTHDDWIRDKVQYLAPNGTSFYQTNHPHSFRLGALSRYAQVVRPLIRSLRLLGARAHTKFIPKQYLESSIENRWHLLQGLMDTDGAVGAGGTLSFCTTSPQLREGFVDLVRSLGGCAMSSERHPTYTYNGEKKNGRVAFVINVRLPQPWRAVTLPRKLERIVGYQYEDSFFLGVKSIEPDGEEESSCLTIDHPDRLYVTDDFIVTHNTWIVENVVKPCFGKIGYYPVGNSSAAGIMGTLRRDARPVVFDEAEGKGQRGIERRDMIIEMLRYSSSESDSEVVKGTAGHGTVSFKVQSQYLMASIGVGLTEAADKTRIVVGQLGRRTSSDASFEQLKALVRQLPKDLPERLLRRQLKNLRVIRENAETLATVIALQLGSRRIGDQIGTLMAGDFSLATDRLLSYPEAEALVASRMEQKRFDELSEVQNEKEDLDLLEHIASFVVRANSRHGYSVDRTIGELIQIAAGKRADDQKIDMELADEGLRRIGMAYQVIDDVAGFWIARSKTYIATEVMRRSAFSQGWDLVLKNHPLAKVSDRQKSFGGYKLHAIWLPYDVWVGEREVPVEDTQ